MKTTWKKAALVLCVAASPLAAQEHLDHVILMRGEVDCGTGRFRLPRTAGCDHQQEQENRLRKGREASITKRVGHLKPPGT